MKKKQLFGLIGSIVLFFGVFAPVVSVPIMGNINYFQNGKGVGTIILIFAAISFVLALTKKYKGLWFTGLGSIGIILLTFIIHHYSMSQVKAQIEAKLGGDLFFHELANMALQSVKLQWGWALLIVGAVLIIASAAMKED